MFTLDIFTIAFSTLLKKMTFHLAYWVWAYGVKAVPLKTRCWGCFPCH